MKKILLLVVAVFAVVLMAPQVSANVNNFSFSSFEADYYLSKDDEGRSTMKVVEKLTAEFPEIDQNKGIERNIPYVYEGRELSFEFVSLTRNGQPEPVFEQRKESEEIIIATGTDDYVRGTQVYEFTYTLRDVTRSFDNHQELYWNTNGTGWTQRFGGLVARVHLDPSIYAAYNGQKYCYQGVAGMQAPCSDIEEVGNLIEFRSGGVLPAGHNVTFAIGFLPDTFESKPLTIAEMVPYVVGFVSLMLIMSCLVIMSRQKRDHPGRGTIVPEYLPPRHESIFKSVGVLSSQHLQKLVPALIIDLAVKRNIRIIEEASKRLFSKKPKYSLELLNTNNLLDDEKAFLVGLMGSDKPGTVYKLDPKDRVKTLYLRSLSYRIPKNMLEGGYRINHKKLNGKLSLINLPFIFLSFLIAVTGLGMYVSSQIQVILMAISFVHVMVFMSTVSKKPLTDKGRTLKDYLMGLKMYIKLAEAERLKILQSPTGAQKVPIKSDDKAQIVKLYERVLPYAILFGQEKEWAKYIGEYYESQHTQPYWYSGTGTFNYMAFSTSLSSFSSSSSSASGLGGGGSSGGGGGGGGGGGR